MKDLSIIRLLVLFVCILLKISIFGDFAKIYPFSTKNGITLGHLHRYISKSFFFQISFSKILQKDVKLMYGDVCQVSRGYL